MFVLFLGPRKDDKLVPRGRPPLSERLWAPVTIGPETCARARTLPQGDIPVPKRLMRAGARLCRAQGLLQTPMLVWTKPA